MRVVKEIAHPQLKITVYAWNNRYLIKFERGLIEQTFKINETDLAGEADVDALLDSVFIEKVTENFLEMERVFIDTQRRTLG